MARRLLELSNLTTRFFTSDGVVKAVDGRAEGWNEAKAIA